MFATQVRLLRDSTAPRTPRAGAGARKAESIAKASSASGTRRPSQRSRSAGRRSSSEKGIEKALDGTTEFLAPGQETDSASLSGVSSAHQDMARSSEDVALDDRQSDDPDCEMDDIMDKMNNLLLLAATQLERRSSQLGSVSPVGAALAQRASDAANFRQSLMGGEFGFRKESSMSKDSYNLRSPNMSRRDSAQIGDLLSIVLQDLNALHASAELGSPDEEGEVLLLRARLAEKETETLELRAQVAEKDAEISKLRATAEKSARDSARQQSGESAQDVQVQLHSALRQLETTLMSGSKVINPPPISIIRQEAEYVVVSPRHSAVSPRQVPEDDPYGVYTQISPRSGGEHSPSVTCYTASTLTPRQGSLGRVTPGNVVTRPPSRMLDIDYGSYQQPSHVETIVPVNITPATLDMQPRSHTMSLPILPGRVSPEAATSITRTVTPSALTAPVTPAHSLSARVVPAVQTIAAPVTDAVPLGSAVPAVARDCVRLQSGGFDCSGPTRIMSGSIAAPATPGASLSAPVTKVLGREIGTPRGPGSFTVPRAGSLTAPVASGGSLIISSPAAIKPIATTYTGGAIILPSPPSQFRTTMQEPRASPTRLALSSYEPKVAPRSILRQHSPRSSQDLMDPAPSARLMRLRSPRASEASPRLNSPTPRDSLTQLRTSMQAQRHVERLPPRLLSSPSANSAAQLLSAVPAVSINVAPRSREHSPVGRQPRLSQSPPHGVRDRVAALGETITRGGGMQKAYSAQLLSAVPVPCVASQPRDHSPGSLTVSPPRRLSGQPATLTNVAGLRKAYSGQLLSSVPCAASQPREHSPIRMSPSPSRAVAAKVSARGSGSSFQKAYQTQLLSSVPAKAYNNASHNGHDLTSRTELLTASAAYSAQLKGSLSVPVGRPRSTPRSRDHSPVGIRASPSPPSGVARASYLNSSVNAGSHGLVSTARGQSDMSSGANSSINTGINSSFANNSSFDYSTANKKADWRWKLQWILESGGS